MTVRIPEQISLNGKYVLLEPLTFDGCVELAESLARPEVFQTGFGGGTSALLTEPVGFAHWLMSYCVSDGVRALIRIADGPSAGVAIGTSSLYAFSARHECCMLGYTAYRPEVWGSVVNPECKLLLLDLAFTSGFGRVELRADALNTRSRAAITKLGATFEGIRRRDASRPNGTWRDAAIFSIVIDEWPVIREKLQRRVDQASFVELESSIA